MTSSPWSIRWGGRPSSAWTIRSSLALVRLFYCNLEFNRQQPSITSLVNGTRIHLTCESLSAMLGVPNKGIKLCKSGTWCRGDCHPLEALRLMCGNDKIRACSRPHIRFLPARNRLLHDMVMSMFLPRGSGRDRVSRTDLFLLKKILHGEKVNLPHLIIHHMINSVSMKYLPYGMLLTKIFTACKVDMAELWEPLKSKEIYNSHLIHRMGYVLTETGRMAKMLTPGNPDEEQMEVEPVEGDEATAVMESEGKQEKKLAAMDEEDKPIPVMYGVRSKGKGKRL